MRTRGDVGDRQMSRHQRQVLGDPEKMCPDPRWGCSDLPSSVTLLPQGPALGWNLVLVCVVSDTGSTSQEPGI